MRQSTFSNNSPPLSSGMVRVYAYYRFFLAALLLGMYLSEFVDTIFGTLSTRVFLAVSISLVVITSTSLLWLIQARFQCGLPFLFINLLVDIVGFNLLIFASDGLGSGIGFLLLVVIATGALIFTGQLPLLLAAVASIMVIVGTLLLIDQYGAGTQSLFPAAILGTLLFATALLFRTLNSRLQETETFAVREAEQAAHLQRLNEAIVNRMETGIVLLDELAQVKLINNSAITYLGNPPTATQSTQDNLSTLSPELFQQYQNWSTRPWVSCPPLTIARTNTEVQCNFERFDDQNENHTILFLEDTRSTAQNVQQLKLASLGRLAGSIAHEIRNPLGAISHAAQLLMEQKDTSAADQSLVEIINRHSVRVDAIVDSVLTLSRQQAPIFQTLKLGSWLNTFAADYTNSSEPDGTLEIKEQDIELEISFDPGHLNQILSNLIDNAFRYSKQNTGEAWAKISCHLDKSSGRPCLDILDKGEGIEQQNIAQIFEPFFTTSSTGTGLGLYLAKERCEFNYATLSYLSGNSSGEDFFRIKFSAPRTLTMDRPNDSAKRFNS